jgi:hypothetical protein
MNVLLSSIKYLAYFVLWILGAVAIREVIELAVPQVSKLFAQIAGFVVMAFIWFASMSNDYVTSKGDNDEPPPRPENY